MSSRGQQGLLDTSAVIDLADLDPDSLPLEPVMCTITLAELSVGPLVATAPEEQAARQLLLQQAEADFEPLPFDAAAARAFGSLAASLRSAGLKPTARAHDALIAAVAVSQGLDLYTANPDDFTGIDGLMVHTVNRAGAPPPHTGDTAGRDCAGRMADHGRPAVGASPPSD